MTQIIGEPRVQGPSVRLVYVLLVLGLVLPATFVYAHFIDSPAFFDDENLRSWLRNARDGLHFEPRVVALAYTLLNMGLDVPPLQALRSGNLLVHLINTLLVWRVGERMLSVVGDRVLAPAAYRPSAAYFAALLFSVHPVASYATGYVIQRTILLSTLFALLTILWHVRAQQQGRPLFFLTAVGGYALSVFSKEHSILLPTVLLVFSYWLHRQDIVWRRGWNWVWPAYAGVALWILVLRQSAVAQGTLYEPMAQTFAELPEYPYLASVATQLVLFFKYVVLWLFPDPRAMSIDVQHDLPGYVLPWVGLGACLAILGLAAFAWRSLRRRDEWSIAGCVALGALLLFGTELWAIRLSESFVLYRSYLWMPLLPLLPVLAIRGLAKRWNAVSARTALITAAGSLMLALGNVWGLVDRLHSMSSSQRLWADAVSKNTGISWPGVARAHTNLGIEFARAKNRDQARWHLEAAIAYNPVAYPAYCALATLYLEQHDPVRARHYYQIAVRQAPDDRCVAILRRYLQ